MDKKTSENTTTNRRIVFRDWPIESEGKRREPDVNIGLYKEMDGNDGRFMRLLTISKKSLGKGNK